MSLDRSASRFDEVFLKLKALLEPFGMTRFYTDDWGAYERHLASEKQVIGKQYKQKIKRKHLTLRTRIKRLARKTIGFSNLRKCMISLLLCLSTDTNLECWYNIQI